MEIVKLPGKKQQNQKPVLGVDRPLDVQPQRRFHAQFILRTPQQHGYISRK